jgi:hypothetical protein
MSDKSLPCVACGRDLEQAIPGIGDNQPYGGTAFATSGHYGSTVFDPMDDSALELNICDPCLVRAGRRGRVIHHGYFGRGKRTAKTWKPPASGMEARQGGDSSEAPSSDDSPTAEGGDAQPPSGDS